MLSQRRSSRTRALLQGRVVFNNRFSLIECTVRDLSETGAQVAFAHPVEIPAEVELEVPKKGLATRARVMWSNGKTHGLMFVKEGQEDVSGIFPVASAEPEALGKRTIQDVLEDARNQIARIAGVSADAVRLKLEIDY